MREYLLSAIAIIALMVAGAAVRDNAVDSIDRSDTHQQNAAAAHEDPHGGGRTAEIEPDLDDTL